RARRPHQRKARPRARWVRIGVDKPWRISSRDNAHPCQGVAFAVFSGMPSSRENIAAVFSVAPSSPLRLAGRFRIEMAQVRWLLSLLGRHQHTVSAHHLVLIAYAHVLLSLCPV